MDAEKWCRNLWDFASSSTKNTERPVFSVPSPRTGVLHAEENCMIHSIIFSTHHKHTTFVIARGGKTTWQSYNERSKIVARAENTKQKHFLSALHTVVFAAAVAGSPSV